MQEDAGQGAAGEESSAPSGPMPRRLTRRRLLGAVAASAACGALGYGWSSNRAEVVDREVPHVGLRTPLRVLLISDLHLPSCLVDGAAVAEAAAAFDPHLVVLGGDTADTRGNEALIAQWLPALAPPLGAFAILGNWEHWGRLDLGRLRSAYEGLGVRLLRNERVDVDHAGARICVVGLDDLVGGSPDTALAEAAILEASKDGASAAPLVLAHCPAMFDRLPAHPLLCLSGHTHGGQIAPFGLAPFTPPGSGSYVRGLHHGPGHRRLYVTRGVGNSVVPFRLGSRPEITRLTLVSA